MSMFLQVGAKLQDGRYEIVRHLSKSNYSRVYEARNTVLPADSNVCVIKELFVSEYSYRDVATGSIVCNSVKRFEELKEFFLDDAEALFQLRHPNIARVVDVFEENNTAYYVMEYVEGSSLFEMVSSNGKLKVDVALGYVRKIAEALEYLHSNNRLHLSIDPSSIIVGPKGNVVLLSLNPYYKYVDVYNVKEDDISEIPADYFRPRGLMEKYISFEMYNLQGKNQPTENSDVYSLGAVLYYLVTGTHPASGEIEFPGCVSQRLNKVVNQSRNGCGNHSIKEFVELLGKPPVARPEPQDVVDYNAGYNSVGDVKKGTNVDLEDNADVDLIDVADVDLIDDADVELIDETDVVVVEEPVKKPALSHNTTVQPSKKDSKLKVIIFALFLIVAIAALIWYIVMNYMYSSYYDDYYYNYDNNYYNNYSDTSGDYNSGYSYNNDDESGNYSTSGGSEEYSDNNYIIAEGTGQVFITGDYETESSYNSSGISTYQKVDLGLSVYWGGWNVGASSPEGYGNYYAWGETSAKYDYSTGSYQYYNGSDYVYIGSDISGTYYDVARYYWGGNWRLPTDAEYQELIDYCIWTWTTYNGVSGYKITGPNGNSIFLPAAGCRRGTELYERGYYCHYWLGSLYEDYSGYAYIMCFSSSSLDVSYLESRECGYTVRPVCSY